MAAAGVPTIDLFGLTLELESDIGEIGRASCRERVYTKV